MHERRPVSELMNGVTDWPGAGGYRGFLGEFGAAADATRLPVIDDLLDFVGANSEVWLGSAVWGGDPWWGESVLTVEPRSNGHERAQKAVFSRHLTVPCGATGVVRPNRTGSPLPRAKPTRQTELPCPSHRCYRSPGDRCSVNQF